MTQGLRWLADRSSPFYVRPRPSADLVRWLWRFRSAARKDRMETAVGVLASITVPGALAWDELIDSEGLDCEYGRRGLLSLCMTDKGMAESREESRILGQCGISSRILGPEQIREIEPAASMDVRGGVLFDDDGNLNPSAAVTGLARRVEELGARLETGQEITSITRSGNRVVGVETPAKSYRTQEVVLAAGSWSASLGRTAGLRLPIQPAKGYSVTITGAPGGWRPNMPLMAHEARAALAPIGDGVRMAGTLELAGLDLSISARRVRAIVSGLAQYFPSLGGIEPRPEGVWSGLRPCAPDGLPVIGRPRDLDGLIIATGHAMIGMTLGPITGKLVSQLAGGRRPEIDISPLSPDRFE